MSEADGNPNRGKRKAIKRAESAEKMALFSFSTRTARPFSQTETSGAGTQQSHEEERARDGAAGTGKGVRREAS